MPPSPNSTRYKGKPLLRLLECYALWAIGALSESEAYELEQLTPKLRQVYGATGTWQQIIAGVMKLPPTMPDKIRALWIKNTAPTNAPGSQLSSQQFAEMFVDQTLV